MAVAMATTLDGHPGVVVAVGAATLDRPLIDDCR